MQRIIERKVASVGYSVLGALFVGIIAFMGAAILFNVYQDLFVKH